MTTPAPLRILVTSGYGYWGDFNPTDIDKGDRQIGGGETAMIQVSRHLAKLGHEVLVFYNTARPGKYEGVDYLPLSQVVSFITTLEHDVLVSWDAPSVFRFNDRAKLHVQAFQLNDASLGILDHAIDMYMHPSEWHIEYFASLYPEMTRAKCRGRMTNGVDPHRYARDAKREPHRVIYSSSPDRGLHHLLRFWPRIRSAVPDAELHVFYDIDRWLKTDADMKAAGLVNITAERAALIREFKEHTPAGVEFHGGIGQRQLALEQLKSSIMAYPCDPVRPTEGFSMTCLEAVTAGCNLVTTDADALKELWANAPGATVLPLPVDDNVWVDTLTKLLLNPPPPPEGLRIAPNYTWMGIAKSWEIAIRELLNA